MTISFFFLAAVCEHAYSLAQKLDPNSESVSVLQFRTGLMSVIKVYLFFFFFFGCLMVFLYSYTVHCSTLVYFSKEMKKERLRP